MPFHQLNNYAISILFDSDGRIMCSFKIYRAEMNMNWK